MESIKTIAVCATNIHQDFVHGNLRALYKEASRRGYRIKIFASFSDLYKKNGQPNEQRNIFFQVLNHKPDALILYSDIIKDEEVKKSLITYGKEAGIPVISMKENLSDCCSILYDAESALHEILTHLIEVHGCKHINFITGVKGHPVSTRRLAVYADVLRQHGLPIEEGRIAYGDFWATPASQAVEDFLASPLTRPDAIVCANDTMALAACETLKSYGLIVPDDMIVTGMGGIRERDFHFPRLTTGIYDAEVTASFIFNTLEQLFSGDLAMDTDLLIPCKTVYSESCGCTAHNLDVFQQQLTETYTILEQERAYQHEVNDLLANISQDFDLISLLKEFDEHVHWPGITSYHIYLKADLVRLTDVPIEGDFPEAPYVLADLRTIGDHRTVLIKAMTEQQMVETDNALITEANQFIYIPLNSDDTFFGFLVIDHQENDLVPELLYRLINAMSISLDTMIKRASLNNVSRQLNLVSEQTIQSLAEIVEAKSEFTGLHVKRVSEYTRILAEALDYSPEDVNIIRIASMMHDIGKINTPKEILEKPGKLTPEEFDIIKRHVIEGEKMLIHSPGRIMQTACVIAKQHHEKWDGSGYLGMRGEAINRDARIVALADVFDALVSARPYKPAFPAEQAYRIIVDDKGKHFDPEVVDAFILHFDKFIEVMNSYIDQ